MLKWALIKQNIVKPLIHRIGTAVSMYLVGVLPYADTGEIEKIVAGIVAALLLGVEVAAEIIDRRSRS